MDKKNKSKFSTFEEDEKKRLKGVKKEAEETLRSVFKFIRFRRKQKDTKLYDN